MRYIVFLVMLFGIISFSFKRDDDIGDALKQAGENRLELEKVINHYKKNKNDALKLKAAYFLIENMPGHYGLYRTEGEFPTYDKIPDLKKISSSQLIENIDCAFIAWKLPWSKHLTFQEFCEYILPYRFDDEVVESWRSEFMQKYSWLTDSMKTSTDPVKACEFVNNEIKRWFVFNNRSSIPNAKNPSMILKERNGRCTDQAAIATYAMRAMGIPVVHEYIPQWGNRRLGHDFSAVLSKTGKFIAFLGGELSPGKNEIRDLAPKIYRKDYSAKVLSDFGENAVISFGLDVTEDYIDVTNVKLNTNTVQRGLLQSIYLCVFDNKDWIPVCVGKAVNNELYFDKVGKNIVYLPMSFSNGEAIPLSEPFLIKKDGALLVLKASAAKKIPTLSITRKYPVQRWWYERIDQIKGGIVQASENKSFTNPVDVHMINYRSTMTYQTINVNLNKEYRYWRLFYPDTNLTFPGIAEIEFYDSKNRKLSGEPISISAEVIKKNFAQQLKQFNDSLIAISANSLLTYVNSAKGMSFDNDSFSFFKITKQANFIGLDLLKPLSVSQIKFISENDDNGINEGQIYELYYWTDNDWKSLGEKTGTSTHQLIYHDVPQEALYLLKNLTKGIEQRIFTYDQKEQVWW